MDPRLLRYYSQELQHLREVGAEFAAEFPKIAGRLQMNGMEVADPYVERLLEGVAFLTARLQLRLDAEFPRFTQRLLEVIYPQFLAPVPSMLVAQVRPLLGDQALTKGVALPRGTVLRSVTAASATPCEFTTSSHLTLWPVEVTDAAYFTHAADLPPGLQIRRAAAGVRVRLRCPPGINFSAIAWEDIRLHCSAPDAIAFKLHQLVVGHTIAALVRPASRPAESRVLAADPVVPVGLEDEDALLRSGARGFAGLRLLQEYFAMPQKFLFFDLRGAGAALRTVDESEAELLLLFGRADPTLAQAVDAASFSLHCVPAINLFERRCDRIHVSPQSHEFHVVPDRLRPMDFEVNQVIEVTGFGDGSTEERHFQPLYGAFRDDPHQARAYYLADRRPRILSTGQKREGARSSYVGTEVFLSIVDQNEAPFPDDLRQLAVRALCSNRDLPLHIGQGGARELQIDASAPVAGIRVLRGPTRPQTALRELGAPWKLINQFSLRQLSLSETTPGEGASALRDMLRLYVSEGDVPALRQVEGVLSVRTEPVVRRLPMPGPIAFGRGVQVEIEVDDHAFEGGSAFILGHVLDRWLARHVSLNTFTVLRVRSANQGVLFEGRPRCGTRPLS